MRSSIQKLYSLKNLRTDILVLARPQPHRNRVAGFGNYARDVLARAPI